MLLLEANIVIIFNIIHFLFLFAVGNSATPLELSTGGFFFLFSELKQGHGNKYRKFPLMLANFFPSS